MNSRLASALIGALLALAAGASAMAEDFLRPISLPAKSVVDFSLTRSGTKTVEGRTTGEGLSITFRYRLNIEPNTDGYRVKIGLLGVELPPGLSPEEQASVRQSAQMTAGLEFQAGGDLTPLELIDWRNQVDRMMNLLASLAGVPAGDPALKATRDLYLSMSPEEAAASLLRDWVLPTVPQNMALDLGKPLQLAGSAPGAPRETMELKSIDRAAGKAVIDYHFALDPEVAKIQLAQMIQRLTQSLPPEERPKPEELASLKLEQSTDCQYEMDLRSGLAARTDCTRTLSAVDETMKAERRVDRWVITQAVVAP